MKYFVLLLIALSLTLPQQVFAHGASEASFLKINGKDPLPHPMVKENIVPKTFSVPEDIGPDMYLINKEITFTIDHDVLAEGFSDELLHTSTFTWDFGDGTRGTGEEVRHTYTSIGSKVVTIYISFADEGLPPQPIETFQIEVLPKADYKIPSVVIHANRQELTANALSLNLQNPVAYEAKITNQPSESIVMYAWDFGDGKKSSEQKSVHKYEGEPLLATPVVKVVDKNGFNTYAFGLITNGEDHGGITLPGNLTGAIILGVQVLAIVIGLGIFIWAVLSQKKKKGKSK